MSDCGDYDTYCWENGLEDYAYSPEGRERRQEWERERFLEGRRAEEEPKRRLEEQRRARLSPAERRREDERKEERRRATAEAVAEQRRTLQLQQDQDDALALALFFRCGLQEQEHFSLRDEIYLQCDSFVDKSNGDGAVKSLKFGNLLAKKPDEIIAFFLSESNESDRGSFRRNILHEWDEEGLTHRLMYWRGYTTICTFAEFLVDVRVSHVSSNGETTHFMKLTSPDKDALPDEAATKLATILQAPCQQYPTGTTVYPTGATVQRGVIKGEIKFDDYGVGQTAVSVVGSLIAEERRAKNLESEVGSVTTNGSERTHSRFTSNSSGRGRTGDVKVAFESFREILSNVEEEFRRRCVTCGMRDGDCIDCDSDCQITSSSTCYWCGKSFCLKCDNKYETDWATGCTSATPFNYYLRRCHNFFQNCTCRDCKNESFCWVSSDTRKESRQEDNDSDWSDGSYGYYDEDLGSLTFGGYDSGYDSG